MGKLWVAFGIGVFGCRLAWGQFDLQASHTTASLRGIDSLEGGVAWASGSGGTVLRTVDGGAHWLTCAVPVGAAKLDFRGVQGFDAKTAVIMSSGKGALSKVYRTKDGCATWKLVFNNPDLDGFFDAIHKVTERQMYLLGDPVKGKFALFFSPDQGATWMIADDPGRDTAKDSGAFAASNSSFAAIGNQMLFGSGATATEAPKVYRTRPKCSGDSGACSIEWVPVPAPLAGGSNAAGVFSLAGRTSLNMAGDMTIIVVAVGGDYQKPAESTGTAAWSSDGGEHWRASSAGPAGYRSAVVYSSDAGKWLALGPGGVDVSSDDGKHWTPVTGDTAAGWNAISLPFAVGSKGQIGKLRDGVLK
jgi:photosystem II stability/assembly factor-like uncharacterized protein